MLDVLKTAYRYHRSHMCYRGYAGKTGATAATALKLAHEDIEKGTTRYWSGDNPQRLMRTYTANAETVRYDWREHEITFIDDIEAVGLRLVGFSDEIAPGRVSHTGWYSDSFQSDKYRGVVFQFPSRDGRAVYLSGYQELDSRDRANNPGYCVALRRRDWNLGEVGEDESYDAGEARKQAASEADQLAESHAEESREYDEAWQLGQSYAEYIEESRGYRTARRRLIATLGAARRDMNRLRVESPWVRELCQRIRGDIAGLKESAREAYDKAQEIISANPYSNKEAFNEGAGSSVL